MKTYDRRALKVELARIGVAERQRDESMATLAAAGAALEESVAEHQRVTSTIQAALSKTTNAAERQRLVAELDAENAALQSAADKLNPRIANLQQQAHAAIWAATGRPRVEFGLRASASDSAKQRHWLALQDSEWASIRALAARKALQQAIAAANAPHLNGEQVELDRIVRAWQAEVEIAGVSLQASRAEVEASALVLLEE